MNYDDEPDLFSAHAFGNNSDELEMAALDEARSVFGPDRNLRIQHGFQIVAVTPHDGNDTDKKFHAHIRVLALVP